MIAIKNTSSPILAKILNKPALQKQPTLQKPCILDIMRFCDNFSTTTALIFIQTSVQPIIAPTKIKQIAYDQTLGKQDNATNTIANKLPVVTITFLQPNFLPKRPPIGITIKALIPMHNNNNPKISASICKRSLIIGIIGAHVEMAKPGIKKAILAAYCSFLPTLNCINSLSSKLTNKPLFFFYFR